MTSKEPEFRQLGDYLDDSRQLPIESFAGRHGEAFLLHHGPFEQSVSPDPGRTTLAVEEPGEQPGGRFDPRSFVVFPLPRKSKTDTGSDLIWLGRGHNNDIVIPAPSASTIHSFLKKSERGEFYIQDMNSMNGTFVDDDPVPAQGRGGAVKLESGARVRLGAVSFTFLRASEFCTLVKRLLD
jgi:hypothetical protein